jgi:transposase-like protein
MDITNETRPMKCNYCGADSTSSDNQPSVVSTSVCPECGRTLSDADETYESRGFLTRLSRFGLGVKHRPLFQDHRKEPPQ